MGARTTAALAATALTLLAPLARADRVPAPPEACPDGARAETSHCGPTCDPWACSSDAECQEGTCQERGLCLEEIQCTSRGGPYTHTVVRGPCGADGTCGQGTCRTQRVCSSAPPRQEQPTPPPPAPADAAPAPQAPAPQAPAPQDAAAPPATPPASAQGEQGSGAACRLAPAGAGDAAAPVFLAALFAGAWLWGRRRAPRA